MEQISQETRTTEARSKYRRLALLATGLGLGAMLAYVLVKVLGQPAPQFSEHVVDDMGTSQQKAAKILRRLRDRAFESSDEKLALALGRPAEEVAGWQSGSILIDDDVVMKARGIAMNRGVIIE